MLTVNDKCSENSATTLISPTMALYDGLRAKLIYILVGSPRVCAAAIHKTNTITLSTKPLEISLPEFNLSLCCFLICNQVEATQHTKSIQRQGFIRVADSANSKYRNQLAMAGGWSYLFIPHLVLSIHAFWLIYFNVMQLYMSMLHDLIKLRLDYIHIRFLYSRVKRMNC